MHLLTLFTIFFGVFIASSTAAPVQLDERGAIRDFLLSPLRKDIESFEANIMKKISDEIPYVAEDLIAFTQDHLQFDGVLGFLVEKVVRPVLKAHIPFIDRVISNVTIETAKDLTHEAVKSLKTQLGLTQDVTTSKRDLIALDDRGFISDQFKKVVCPPITRFVSRVREDFRVGAKIVVDKAAMNLYELLPLRLREVLKVLLGVPVDGNDKRGLWGLEDKLKEMLRQIREKVHDRIEAVMNVVKVKSIEYVEGEIWERISQHIICEH